MSQQSYEEIMAELEDLDEKDQKVFVEALDSRLERRIEINEEQQQFSEESALDRDEPFDQEEFTYFQDTAREVMREYRDKGDIEDLDEVSKEYAIRLSRTGKVLEESGQEAGVMDWLSDLDNLVYTIAESERRTISQFGDIGSRREDHLSEFEEFTYQSVRDYLGALDYDQFLEVVDEVKEMEESQEFDSDEYISEFEDEMNISGDEFEKVKEEAQKRMKEREEELEMYLAAVPEEVVNRAPHRYREAIYSVRSEENGSEYEMPSMKDVVENDFAAALEEVKS